MKQREPAGTGSTLSNRSKLSLRLRPIEAGELHPLDRCAWCAAPSSSSTLRGTTLLWTHAPAFLCEDTIGCARRRGARRRAA